MKIRIKRISWSAYFTIGMIISIIVSLLGIQHYYVYMLLTIAVYYLALNTGKKINIAVNKVAHLQKLTLVFAFLVVSRILVCYSLAAAISNIGIILMYYLEIITSYVAFKRYKTKDTIFELPLTILLFTAIFGIFTYILGYNPLKAYFDNVASDISRISSVYVHPIPCAVFFGICLWMIAFYAKGAVFTTALILLTSYAIYLTGSRSTWVSIGVILLLLAVHKMLHPKYKIPKKRMFTIISAVAFLIILAACMHSQIAEIWDGIYHRLFAKSYSEDMSYTWRFMAAGTMISQLSPFSLRTYLGHGYNAAANYMRDMINIGGRFSYNVSTVDNGYVSILYDFGVIGFVIYCIPLVQSIIGIFKDSDKNECCIDCIILTIMLSSLFFEAAYWASISFVLMSLIGFKMYYIENGRRADAK